MLIRPADMVRTKAPEADLRRQYAKTFWSCFGISALLLAEAVVDVLCLRVELGDGIPVRAARIPRCRRGRANSEGMCRCWIRT